MTKKDDPWKEWEEIGLKREEHISLDWAKALIVKIVFWIVAFFIFSNPFHPSRILMKRKS